MEKIKKLKAGLEAHAAIADELIKEFPTCSSAQAVRGRINHVADMLASLEREIAVLPKASSPTPNA
jgi:outer membrane protein assembly factor BamD (BamD/ComL family)